MCIRDRGYVFGEHGDTSFIPWSMVTVEGIKLDEYTKGARRLGIDANDFDPDEVITYVRKSGGEIIKRDVYKRQTIHMAVGIRH